MAAASVGQKYLVTFISSLNAQRVMNTFHYQISALTGTPTIQAVSDRLYAAMSAASKMIPKFLDCSPTNLLLNEVWIQVVGSTRYAKSVYLPTLTGTGVGNAQTANVAAVIERRGEAAERKAVGSVHIAIGADDNWISSGQTDPALQTRLLAFAAEMVLPVNTTTTVSTLNPILDNGPSNAQVTPITQAAPKVTVRVMRRRTVGLGI